MLTAAEPAVTSSGHASAMTGGRSAIHVGGTGVVGALRDGDGSTVLLRADVDALPLGEDTGLPYPGTATGTTVGRGGEGRGMLARRHGADSLGPGRGLLDDLHR